MKKLRHNKEIFDGAHRATSANRIEYCFNVTLFVLTRREIRVGKAYDWPYRSFGKRSLKSQACGLWDM